MRKYGLPRPHLPRYAPENSVNSYSLKLNAGHRIPVNDELTGLTRETKGVTIAVQWKTHALRTFYDENEADVRGKLVVSDNILIFIF